VIDACFPVEYGVEDRVVRAITWYNTEMYSGALKRELVRKKIWV
jgi:hypothetical protein